MLFRLEQETVLLLGALFKAVGLLRTLPASKTGTKNDRRACLDSDAVLGFRLFGGCCSTLQTYKG